MAAMGPLSYAFAVIMAAAVLAWLASLVTRNVSFVDSLWPLFFLMAALVYAASLPAPDAGALLVLLLVCAWSLRLSLHIALRNRGAPEDHRYRRIRANHEPHFAFKSLYVVFLLQAVLAWIVSVPLLYAVDTPDGIGALHVLALCVWILGFVFEAGGDWQLQRFRARDDAAGRVLDTGLWRYTRHPNYFGDACIWWSFWLFAAANGAWWTVFSPLLMTWLLLKVSGVALLERTLAERRPGYAEYVRRTSAFLPWPPQARNSADGERP